MKFYYEVSITANQIIVTHGNKTERLCINLLSYYICDFLNILLKIKL